jgi:hypothetical protein
VAISNICESDVNEHYLPYLSALNEKIAFVKTQNNKQIRACKDIAPELDKLRDKVGVPEISLYYSNLLTYIYFPCSRSFLGLG